MSLADQLPALIGVVVGSVGSYAAQSLTERRKWQIQKLERWDEKRFETYIRYGNALKVQLRIAQRIGAAMGYTDVTDPLEPSHGFTELAEAESHRAAESAARDHFYESARGDLGIGGAPPPSGEWPRQWRAELSERTEPRP